MSAERVQKIKARAIELLDEELVIEWSGGREVRYPLEQLRRGCPCAGCRESRSTATAIAADGELPMLGGEAATATAAAEGFQRVGRYGIRIKWSDGHDAGIYTFDFLRQSAEEGDD
jgi:DUF971 family protein